MKVPAEDRMAVTRSIGFDSRLLPGTVAPG